MHIRKKIIKQPVIKLHELNASSVMTLKSYINVK